MSHAAKGGAGVTDERRIAEIKEREDLATEGPWSVVKGNEADDWGVTEKGTRGKTIAQMCWDKDAEFIAHARADIPWLLEQLEKAEARRDGLARMFIDQLPSEEDVQAIMHYLKHGQCSGDAPVLEKEKLRQQIEWLEQEIARLKGEKYGD